jgi:hypothetical protein
MLRMGMGLDVCLIEDCFRAAYFERFCFIYIIVTIIMSLQSKLLLSKIIITHPKPLLLTHIKHLQVHRTSRQDYM